MTGPSYIRTLLALGLRNVARVAVYRAGLRSGLHRVRRLAAPVARGPFFAPAVLRVDVPPANLAWEGSLRWYDWKCLEHDNSPPDWFAHPFANGPISDTAQPWWQIGDFVGDDIKNVWELSRFAWAPTLATQASSGNEAALRRLNAWTASWAEANPPYRGPNWKCGQEASIRVIHLLTAALVLEQQREPLPGLTGLLRSHLQRIAPTVSYAIGQQNNHATSEAAALFAGGDLLASIGDVRGARWARTGRRLLEESATRLIETDGSFSQYSLNYHRVMLDTFSFAEVWRRTRGLAPFSPPAMLRVGAAVDWLHAMIDMESGDGPNLGANDGARLIPLTDTDYRDFRPSLQLASALFRNSRAQGAPGPWDHQLAWLGVDRPEAVAPAPGSRTFGDGGYHVLRSGRTFAVMRFPRFRFRPSQADALHLDLWVGGRNLLHDGGTYSYNDSRGTGEFLAGTAAHNTVQFDGREQMPRLGRFLFGDWLEASSVEAVHSEGGRVSASAGYVDAEGAEHHRRVELGAEDFSCTDSIGGRFSSAVLRWRLRPGDYELAGSTVSGAGLVLSIDAEGAAPRLTLTSAPESLCYQEHHPIPVIEAHFDGPAKIVTIGRFAGHMDGGNAQPVVAARI